MKTLLKRVRLTNAGILTRLVLSLLLACTAAVIGPSLLAQEEEEDGANCCCDQNCANCGTDTCPSGQNGGCGSGKQCYSGGGTGRCG